MCYKETGLEEGALEEFPKTATNPQFCEWPGKVVPRPVLSMTVLSSMSCDWHWRPIGKRDRKQ